MAKGSSTPMRVTADIAATAASVAPAENRTMAEQINYWARIGMQVERSGSVTNRRVLAVAAGAAPFTTLAPHERTAAHALIDAAVAERTATERFGRAARATGQTTVSLDDGGNLVQITPDGRRRRL